MQLKDIIRSLFKIKKLLVERGAKITFKKLIHIAAIQLSQSSLKKTILKRDAIFKNLDHKVLIQDIEHLFSIGLFHDLNKIKLEIRKVQIDVADKIINESQILLGNKFTIYGHLKLIFKKNEFSWRLDPLTGFEWSKVLNRKQPINQKPYGTDIKTIWEIARFQFLCPLAQAYLLTGEEQYAHFAIDKVNSWIDENHFPFGPHWTVAMESSIRLINWCVYLPLLDIFKYADLSFRNRITQSILEHLIYIRENLEVSPSGAGNHYLADLVGLLMARCLFPSISWAVDTSKFAANEFEREVQRQFMTNGINFEGSLAYHRLSTEMCLIGAALIKKSKEEIPRGIIDQLRKVADFTRYYSDTCEECPTIGDNDSGVFLKFFVGQELNRHKYLKYLFDCILWNKNTPGNWDEFLCSIHFTNTNRPSIFDSRKLIKKQKISVEVKNFDGLVISRYGNEALFFNTLQSYEGHVHNDKLAIYPVVGKQLLFVDRGSFSYTGYPEKRHQDRSTVSHNCPVLNNWEQNKIWKEDVFYLSRDADCGNVINSSEDKISVTGWHNGYARFSPNLKVFRKVEWDVEKKTMLISDWGEGKSAKDSHFTRFFIINPSWFAELKANCIVFTNETATIRFEDLTGVGFALRKGTYCPTYQQELPCQILTASYHGGINEKINFLLSY